MHPSEEHELVSASTTRRVLGPDGQAVGVLARIVPGSAGEREALQAIDDERWQHERHLGRTIEDRRRALRRHWRTRGRHEA